MHEPSDIDESSSRMLCFYMLDCGPLYIGAC